MTAKVIVVNGRVRAFCPHIGLMVVRPEHFKKCPDCIVFTDVDSYEEFATVASLKGAVKEIRCSTTDKKMRCPACDREGKKANVSSNWFEANHKAWGIFRSGHWLASWAAHQADLNGKKVP